MREVTRWVCSACGGVYFNAPTGRCPGCNGQGKEMACEEDDAGVVRPKAPEAPAVDLTADEPSRRRSK